MQLSFILLLHFRAHIQYLFVVRIWCENDLNSHLLQCLDEVQSYILVERSCEHDTSDLVALEPLHLVSSSSSCYLFKFKVIHDTSTHKSNKQHFDFCTPDFLLSFLLSRKLCFSTTLNDNVCWSVFAKFSCYPVSS